MLDQRIINIDRAQRFFAQNFLDISDKMMPADRLQRGAAKMKQHQAIFRRDDKDFGVPAAVISAFWGLESDFGAGQGKDQVRSNRSQRSPMTAAVARCSAGTCSMRCA